MYGHDNEIFALTLQWNKPVQKAYPALQVWVSKYILIETFLKQQIHEHFVDEMDSWPSK